MLKKIVLVVVSFSYMYIFSHSEIFFTVIVPSYNNERWVKKNLNSIFSQDYPYFRVIYINDASKDRTGELVQQYIKKHNLQHKCTYIENKTNQGALYNLYYAIHSCHDKEVVVTVDGDDWLAHSQVLTRVSQEYQDSNVWMTYGNFVTNQRNVSCCDYYNPEIIQKNTFRTDRWKASHLRTFYAQLFKLIQYRDLQYQGRFFKVAWDLAMMFPMLEMAQERHRFIPDVLYVYNVENILNDFKVYPKEQLDMDTYIRENMAPYSRIDNLFE
jgi:glycosyltransferase involved in cell wall biosynthesis